MLRKLKRKSRRKGLVILAILCISSSTLWKVCIQAEKFYNKHYLIPEVKQYNDKWSKIIKKSSTPLYLMTSLPIQDHVKKLSSTNCSDESCSNLLSISDSMIYRQCTRRASKCGPIDQGNCIFMNSTTAQPIALASFPGSGNTWVRGLLQQVTGFCTGSLYCDASLRRHGFVGEGIATGSALVVKTHKPSFIAARSSQSKNSFQLAIFIIRDPYDAIISERNRRLAYHADCLSNHTQTFGREYFGNNFEWINLVTKELKGWQKLIEFWLEWGQNHPLLVVQYEDLVNNTSREIDVMLRFIGIQISLEDIRQKLRVQFNSYHRKGHGNFTHYTTQQISQVNDCLRKTQEQLMRTGMDTKYNLYVDKYVRHYNT